MTTYYDYNELKKEALDKDTFESKQALANWFDRHYIDGWNGEYYDVDEYKLIPVYEETEDGDFIIIDWELK